MALQFRNNEKATINAIYRPPEEIQKDRKMVYHRLAMMKSGRGTLEADWDKWEKQYEAWRPNRSPDDWQSNIVPPFTSTLIERALAEIVDQTIRPKVVAKGLEDKPKAKLMNYISDYIWDIAYGDLELYASLKQLLVLGNTIWEETYWRDKRIVKALKKFDLEKNIEEYIEKEIYDYDDLYGECVNLRNFYLDPMARSINRGRFKAKDCIRRYIMDVDAFKESLEGSIFDQFGKVKIVKAGGDLNYYQFYTPPEGIDKDRQVEVLYYWARNPDKFIIMANDVVIRDGPNPYAHKQLPFAEGMDVKRLVGKYWARSEPALLESIHDELTTLRRMRIDRQHMDIWKMFLVSNREVLDDEEAIISPSRFLYVDDPKNSIVPLEYRDINQSAYKEEEILKAEGREVTGIESPQPSGTATEAAIFKESTMKALRLKIWLVSRELLTGIMELRVPNIVQYYSLPKAQRIVGERFEPEYRQIRTTDVLLKTEKTGDLREERQKGENFFIVTPDLIVPKYGKYDLKMTGEPSFPISKPLQQQKVGEFMQHPVIQGAIQSGYYDIGRMADALSEVNEYDPEEFKVERPPEGEMVDEEQLLELANRENEIILSGKRVPPTAYATRSHTNIHLAFMDSEEFRKAIANNPDTLANMIYHALGEGKAQEMRQQGGGELGVAPRQQRSVAQGIMGGEAKATTPGRVFGPELTPAGQEVK